MKNSTKSILRCLTLMFVVLCFLTNNAFSQLKIIDAHTHSKDSAAWRSLGVIGGVNMPGSGGGNYPDSDPDVINCYGAIDGKGRIRKESEIVKDLNSNQYKCIKIFLVYHFIGYASDPQLKRIYDLAKARNLTVVFHTGDPYSPDGLVKFAHPRYIEEVVVRYEKVDFVIAHCGNPWTKDAAELAYKNKNVFLECSALVIDEVGKMSQEELNTLMVEPIRWVFNYVKNPRKMMYGSDYPLVKDVEDKKNLKPYLKNYMDAIPEPDRKKVFYENAVCVYKFSADFQTRHNMPVIDCDKWRAELDQKN